MATSVMCTELKTLPSACYDYTSNGCNIKSKGRRKSNSSHCPIKWQN